MNGPVVHAACHPAQAANTRCANAPVIESQDRRAAGGEITREAIVEPAVFLRRIQSQRPSTVAARAGSNHILEGHSVIRTELDGVLVDRYGRIRARIRPLVGTRWP